MKAKKKKAVKAAPPPAFGPEWQASYIKPGRYHMRGGSIAIVTGPCTIKYGIGFASNWKGWKGHLEHHPDGEGLNWSLDGRRSDAADVLHEHDLGKRCRDQTPKNRS